MAGQERSRESGEGYAKQDCLDAFLPLAMTISSSAFAVGAPIPPEFSFTGGNLRPPLSFNEIPPGTEGLVLIMEDPDAPGGPFTHWLIWNMEHDAFGNADPTRDPHAVSGRNGFGEIGYAGPNPPAGERHRYYFHLYALDTMLEELPVGASREQLMSAMADHVLERADLMGTYQTG